MAGVTSYEQDVVNGRAFSMWEEDGVQYRSNLLFYPGAHIELHAHSFGHSAKIRGRMRMTVIAPERQPEEREVSSGEEIFIPAWHEHAFVLLEGVDGVGEVLCSWGAE